MTTTLKEGATQQQNTNYALQYTATTDIEGIRPDVDPARGRPRKTSNQYKFKKQFFTIYDLHITF